MEIILQASDPATKFINDERESAFRSGQTSGRNHGRRQAATTSTAPDATAATKYQNIFT